MFLRGMATDQFSLFLLASSLPWIWVVRIEYLSTFLLLWAVAFSLKYLNKAPLSRFFNFMVNLVTAIVILCCVVVLVFQVEIFAYLVYAIALLLFMGIYLFLVQSYSIVKNSSLIHASMYVVSLAILMFGGIHDLMVSNSMFFVVYISPYAFLFFIMVQLIEFFRRYAYAMDQSEELTRKMVELNHGLEARIEERTKDLREKNEVIEHQNQKLQSDIGLKNKMFSIIGHDVNSPLASIRQGLDLLTDKSLSIDNKDYYLLKLSQSARSLSMLVENLLSWGLSQSRQIKTKLEIIPIYPCVERVIEQLRSVADDKHISIYTDIPKDLVALFDNMTMVIILRNLVSNAVKFTEDGGTILITDIVYEDRVEIKVCDNGVGMSQESIDKILNNETLMPERGTNDERGTGLGLSLCIDLIRLNRSELHIESKLGEGSCFSFSLGTSM